MRQFFSWGSDSKMPSIYVHLSGRGVDDGVLAVYGIKEARESQDPVLRIEQCPRCREQNSPGGRFCQRCVLPLNQPYQDTKLMELVVELLKIMAETHPGIKDRFRELVREKGAEEWRIESIFESGIYYRRGLL